MWQAFEMLGGQQFLEMQNNNVAGARTFVGANNFWKCKTTIWQAFELLGGQQFL